MLAARSRTLFSVSRRAIVPQARSFAYTATAKSTIKERIDAIKSSKEEPEGAWMTPLETPDAHDPEPLYRRAEQCFSMGVATCHMAAIYGLASLMGKREALDDVYFKVAGDVSLGREGTDKPGVTVIVVTEGVEDEELLEASRQAQAYPYLRFDRVRFKISKK